MASSRSKLGSGASLRSVMTMAVRLVSRAGRPAGPASKNG